MAVWLIKMFGISLILTIIIEVAVAYCFRIRTVKKMLLITLVNVLTNPPAVLLHWLGNIYLQSIPDLYLQLAIEVIVVVTEALIYQSFSYTSVCSMLMNSDSTKISRHRQVTQWYIHHSLLFSFASNICSWVAGIILSNCMESKFIF